MCVLGDQGSIQGSQNSFLAASGQAARGLAFNFISPLAGTFHGGTPAPSARVPTHEHARPARAKPARAQPARAEQCQP